MAGKGDCPSAPSRAPVFGVHRSEGEALDGRSGRNQAQNLARKDSCESCVFERIL